MSDEVEALLTQRGLVEDAVRINNCHGFRYCHSAYCIKCMSRRAYRQRKHLLQALPALLAGNSNYQLWFITGAAADSADVNAAAWSAVNGMRRLLKHPRLRGRVVCHFSVLEIAHKRGRQHPCAHVHTLAVTKPMDKGKYRLSRRHWIELWEEACPLHRKRLLPVRRSPKRKGKRVAKNKPHVSLVAKMIPRDGDHVQRVILYCTKWATPRRVARDYRALLNPDPTVFLERVDALKGVPRFFGELHAG